jgi:hypothetical protein
MAVALWLIPLNKPIIVLNTMDMVFHEKLAVLRWLTFEENVGWLKFKREGVFG